MLKVLTFLICFLLCISIAHTQSLNQVKGSIIYADTKSPIQNARITIHSNATTQFSDANGFFILTNLPLGNQLIEIALPSHETQRFHIIVEDGKTIDLGTIALVFDLSNLEENSGLISLTEDDLNDDESQAENTAGLLQSSKDVFQNRAAFDFSQAFFRVRGYDSQNAQVLINGVSMNKLFNGRPQWNNWGGLNDVTRNQELTTGLAPSNHSFGAILGSTNISTRASKYRPGTRISSSFSNRTYVGRAMVTHSSGMQKNGLSYTFSASRRWGNEGFVDGTSYDAFGFFGALEYKWNYKNSLNLTAIYTPSVSYQFGQQGRSRLDYANAPNPNPNYWRYLPNIADKPQIDWNSFYDANTNTTNLFDAGSARYILYEDRTDDKLMTASTTLNTKLTEQLSIDIGGTYKNLISENFGNPIDLLGAEYYTDVNLFTLINNQPAENDALGRINKGLADRIKYNYDIISDQTNTFAQLQFNHKKINFFLSGFYTKTSHQRDGKFLNQTFIDNSLGKSEVLTFSDFGFKGGFTYKFSGRQLLLINAGKLSKAPTIRNSFINSRENNTSVTSLESEQIASAEASYLFRSPLLKTRFTGYFTEFKEGTDINFVFAQSGSGTDFFQEVVTNIDKHHFGLELGIEYQLSTTTKMFAAAALGKHTYSDNANVSINFDTAGFNDDVINTIGFKDLGKTNIKDLRVPSGPQQAYSIGIEYKDPKYWWISGTANYLSNSYIDVSTISRTSDFFINPDDPLGSPFEDIDIELSNKLLEQEEFDGYYLLNITGGKSWRIKGNYLSLFLSINNVFETVYKTGGFEQSRTANYADLVEDTANGESQRSFGNKHWYGLGRSYFLNIAYNF